MAANEDIKLTFCDRCGKLVNIYREEVVVFNCSNRQCKKKFVEEQLGELHSMKLSELEEQWRRAMKEKQARKKLTDFIHWAQEELESEWYTAGELTTLPLEKLEELADMLDDILGK